MKWANKVLTFIFSLTLNATAAIPPHYQSIVERNAFALMSRSPSAISTTTVEAEPSVHIRLTGITTVFGEKRAHLSLHQKGQKPTFLALAEGQSESGIEVVAISVISEEVSIRHRGIEKVLAFTKAGAPETAEPADAGLLPVRSLGPPGSGIPPRRLRAAPGD